MNFRIVSVVSAAGIVALAAGCSTPGPKVGSSGHAVSMISQGSTAIQLVVTEQKNEGQIGAALQDQVTNFWWAKFTVPAAQKAALNSPAGLTVDMSDPSIPLVFTQVYRGVCNPEGASAYGPDPTCWLIEHYQAGGQAVSGEAKVRVAADGSVDSDWDVKWKGMTDRFHGPTQYLQRETTGGSLAPPLPDDGGQP